MLKTFLLGLLIFSLSTNVSTSCVDINTTQITQFLNTSYHHDCYLYTLKNAKCCEYFVHDKDCIDNYKECVNYEDYILNNIYHQCSYHNDTLSDIEYSDACHNFTLHIEPYCCDDLLNKDCYSMYSQCTNHDPNITKCLIPPKYNNNYCASYTSHVNANCCDNFNDQCGQIYNWCLENNPDKINVLDMFLGPKSGHTVGSSLAIHHHINSVEECATLCLDTETCRSFDYIQQFNHCHLSYHVIGDHIDSELVQLLNDPFYTSVYYEKKLNMPYDETSCNVQHVSWLGDGLCDSVGGYNTQGCDYDGGDCCKETCKLYFCGFFEFYCMDPEIVGYPTSYPTLSPTNTTTLLPTSSPSNSPTILTSPPTTSPTNTPTLSTGTPTNAPTLSTISPTNIPTISDNSSFIPSTPSPISSSTVIPTFISTLTPTFISTQTPTLNPTKGNEPKNSATTSSSSSSDGKYTAMYVFLTILVILLTGCIMYATYVYYKTKKMKANAAMASNARPAFSNPLYDSENGENVGNNGNSENSEKNENSKNRNDSSNTDNATYDDYLDYEDDEEMNKEDLYSEPEGIDDNNMYNEGYKDEDEEYAKEIDYDGYNDDIDV